MVFFVYLCPTKHQALAAEKIRLALLQKGASISVFFSRDVTHLLTNYNVSQKHEDVSFAMRLPRNTRSTVLMKLSQEKTGYQCISRSNCIAQAKELGITIVTVADLFGNNFGLKKETINRLNLCQSLVKEAYIKQWLTNIP